MNKGSHLFIQGKLQTRSWDDKESGHKRYRTEIVVFDLTLLGGGRGESAGSGFGSGRSESRQNADRSENQQQEMDSQYGDEELSPDEIPF